MRFGNREVMDLVFKDTITRKPIFYFETLKMTEMGNKTATVYARGGQGNPKLIGWTGDRELTLNCEDALVSPDSFGLFVGTNPKSYTKVVHEKEALDVIPVNGLTGASTDSAFYVELAEGKHGYVVDVNHPMYVFKSLADGTTIVKEITATTTAGTVTAGTYEAKAYQPAITSGSTPTPAVPARIFFHNADIQEGDVVIVDYYFGKGITELRITTKDFPGTFFVEGFTLWRDEEGKDHMARVTIPRAKLTADFQISMKPDGDPSTYKFELEGLKPRRGKDMLTMEIDDDPIIND